MADLKTLGLDDLVNLLKAAGEQTRIRLLALLAGGDLTVSDLTEILGQSQPRISRHMKLLTEAGLIDRYQEGAWAYFRLKHDGPAVSLARQLLAKASRADPVLQRDSERLATVKRARADKAQSFFSQNAGEWNEMRRLHIREEAVDAALKSVIGSDPVDALLDLGTGTGRILQLLAPLYRFAVGVDASRDMLAVARANLDRNGLSKATVRLADILNLPLEDQDYDLVTIHQVLHFLDDPQAAIAEASRMLKPAGRLVVIDFAPHGLDYLREKHAHVRLGFSTAQMSDWMARHGLVVEKAIDLPSDQGGEESLIVSLWLARKQGAKVA
jgi:ubiquinone/menaquinone biosynthesis C-methylase UbiE